MRGRHGSHGHGNQGTAQAGNSLKGDSLKTTKRTMPKDAPIQAQSAVGVEVGSPRNPERIRVSQGAYYPKGLA